MILNLAAQSLHYGDQEGNYGAFRLHHEFLRYNYLDSHSTSKQTKSVLCESTFTHIFTHAQLSLALCSVQDIKMSLISMVLHMEKVVVVVKVGS